MRKVFALLVLSAFFSQSYADDYAQLKIQIKGALNENRYFLCLYGLGCLSMHAGQRGKVFTVMPIDIGNIKRIVIADRRDMSMISQPSVKSCDVKLKSGEKLVISGTFLVKSGKPVIQGLQCRRLV